MLLLLVLLLVQLSFLCSKADVVSSLVCLVDGDDVVALVVVVVVVVVDLHRDNVNGGDKMEAFAAAYSNLCILCKKKITHEAVFPLAKMMSR